VPAPQQTATWQKTALLATFSLATLGSLTAVTLVDPAVGFWHVFDQLTSWSLLVPHRWRSLPMHRNEFSSAESNWGGARN